MSREKSAKLGSIVAQLSSGSVTVHSWDSSEEELRPFLEANGLAETGMEAFAIEHAEVAFTARVGRKGTGKGRKGKLIGFARATTDKAFLGAIDMVFVAKQWRGNGVGSLLVASLLKRLKKYSLPEVLAMSTIDLEDFWRMNGFQDDEEESVLMQPPCNGVQAPPLNQEKLLDALRSETEGKLFGSKKRPSAPGRHRKWLSERGLFGMPFIRRRTPFFRSACVL